MFNMKCLNKFCAHFQSCTISSTEAFSTDGTMTLIIVESQLDIKLSIRWLLLYKTKWGNFVYKFFTLGIQI